MKYDFITIGGATEDITFHTREGLLIANRKDILRQKLMAFEYGAKVKIDRSNSTFGGGAANAAVSFSRLGFRAAALVAVGDDERGQKIIANLKKEKVGTNLVEKIKGAQSGYSFILTGSDNEHIVFSNRGANSELRISAKGGSASGGKNYKLKNLANTKWIYLTSLSGNWENVLKKVFSVKTPLAPLYKGGAKNCPPSKGGLGGLKIAWNPGHRQLEKGASALGQCLKNTSVLIVNKDEAIELVVSCREHCRKSAKFLNNIGNLIKIIRGFGPSIVVITNGRHGAYAYDGKKIYFQSVAREKERVNTTGVGDAFGSSFVAGLELFKGDIKRAMNLAAHNAASVVANLGAQTGLLKRRDI
jgi:sugar/nucleoside kinase (ribokinase family)